MPSLTTLGESLARRHRQRGDHARDRRDWARAKRHYESYLARFADDGAMWIQLGHARKESGDLAGARMAYQRALAFDGDREDALLHLNGLPHPPSLMALRDLAAAERSGGRTRAPALTLADIAPIIERLGRLERLNQLLFHQTLPEETHWRDMPPLRQDAAVGALVFDRSVACRQDSFQQPYFSYWTTKLHQKLGYRRKLWEYVLVCQALFERGLLAPGSRGLGFGVGEEPLSAYFASQGCLVLGTDMASDAGIAAGWTELAEHAAGKEALRRPGLCPDDVFDRNVAFRALDMNAVPADLKGFDFCWSACALEHLGTIEKGLAFIERSIETLKPGGIAVHATELNLSSNDDTVIEGRTVLYRRRDLEELARRLHARGHEVAPFDFDPGYGQVDRYIDLPPYRTEPHLKLAIEGFSTTSFGMIIRRG